MPAQLQPPQREQTHEVAHVKTGGSGIESAIDRDRAALQALREHLAVGRLMDQTACLEIRQDVHAASLPDKPRRTVTN